MSNRVTERPLNFDRGGARSSGAFKNAPTRWYLDLTAWTAALAVSGYPLAGLDSAFFEISDDTASIVFRVMVVVMAVGAFAINSRKHGIRHIDAMLLAFLLLYTLRLVWDVILLQEADDYRELQFFALTTMIPFLAVVLPVGAWHERNAIYCFICVGAAVCVVALTLNLTGFAYNADLNGGRLGYERVNPISLGHAATTTVLAIIVGWRYIPSRVARVIAAVSVMSALWILYMVASRGPLVALVCAVSAYSLGHWMWAHPLKFVIVLCAVVGIFALIDLESIFDSLRLTDVGSDTSSLERIAVSEIAWNEFRLNLLFGSGHALPYGGYRYPHNIVLESGMAMGLIGFVLLSALIVRTFLKAMSAMHNGHELAAVLYIQYVIGAQFSGALWSETGMYLFMGILLAG